MVKIVAKGILFKLCKNYSDPTRGSQEAEDEILQGDLTSIKLRQTKAPELGIYRHLLLLEKYGAILEQKNLKSSSKIYRTVFKIFILINELLILNAHIEAPVIRDTIVFK